MMWCGVEWCGVVVGSTNIGVCFLWGRKHKCQQQVTHTYTHIHIQIRTHTDTRMKGSKRWHAPRIDEPKKANRQKRNNWPLMFKESF